jgi:hypothetical protein
MTVCRWERSLSKLKYVFVFLAAAVVWGNPGACFGAQASKKTSGVESPSTAAERGIDLATKGHCEEALPMLKKSIPKLADKDLLHDAARKPFTARINLHSSQKLSPTTHLL